MNADDVELQEGQVWIPARHTDSSIEIWEVRDEKVVHFYADHVGFSQLLITDEYYFRMWIKEHNATLRS